MNNIDKPLATLTTIKEGNVFKYEVFWSLEGATLWFLFFYLSVFSKFLTFIIYYFYNQKTTIIKIAVEELPMHNKDNSVTMNMFFLHLPNICVKQLLWREPCAMREREWKYEHEFHPCPWANIVANPPLPLGTWGQHGNPQLPATVMLLFLLTTYLPLSS